MTRYIKNFVFVVLFFLPFFVMAQIITGTVKDKGGDFVPYVKITEFRATNKSAATEDGSFSIRVSSLPTKLIFNGIGFKERIVSISNVDAISVVLEEVELKQQTKLNVGNSHSQKDASVAITYISTKDIKDSGKINFEDLLTYGEVSFNATNHSQSGITTHFNVADLRGLGSSRMLVLINGKRKNLSAVTHINDTYGKGEVGTDLESIPVAAIERIEILREGASAIYGSDAIAGVINVILKKDSTSTVNFNIGTTSKGDGFGYGGDVNGTFDNEKGAYVNYTIAFQHEESTDRAGTPEKDDLFGVSNANSWVAKNSNLGMTIGQPEMNTSNVYFNAAKPFHKGKGEFYAMLGVSLRKGESSTFFITPYMGLDVDNLYGNQGYQPYLKTATTDNMDVIGVKYNTNGYNIDFSGTYGVNKVGLVVDNSLNPSMGDSSPTIFDNGTYTYKNSSVNLNITKSFDELHVTFGSEYKLENYIIKQGEHGSWYNEGSVGFRGITFENELDKYRNSLGAFANLDYDVSEDFAIGLTGRYDSYSDVGELISYKVNARYKMDIGTVRASYGTNFRAAALQQRHMNYTSFSGSMVLNEAQRTSLGIADLEAETATNINVGILVNPIKNLAISVDYYKVDINDRVVLTNDLTDEISVDPYEQILADNNVNSIRFFTNAVDTETQGIDFSARYDKIRFSKGVLGFSLMVNWIDVNVTDINQSSLMNYEIFNNTEKSLLDTGRPKIKGILGVDFEQDSFKVTLNNRYFGETKWRHINPNNTQKFGAKVLTDLMFNYELSKKFNFNLSVNNILNVYPDTIVTNGDVLTDLGGRFQYSRQLNQFGILGMHLQGGVSINF